MISYDILQTLEDNCLELLDSTSGMVGLDGEKSMRKAHQSIMGALRKIVIANEMMGKGIICISGLQGAGKSTLMKNFYGMSSEYFNIALGVGEKIPVFISESSTCKKPETYAICLYKNGSGNYKREYKMLSPEEFRNASAGNEVDQDIMYLELKVPYKHLDNESYSFMLLPGFEKRNDYWKSLIDFSVKCSDTSIFVFNESSFSKYDNQVLLDKIHEKFGDSLIYAISQSDLSEDYNAEVKKTCIEVMGIKEGEEDRVVCVGEYSKPEQNNKWINELKQAIQKYCNSIETARKNCTDYIYEVIEDEIVPQLSDIKEALQSDSSDKIITELENEAWLDAFDRVINKRKDKLKKNLDEALKQSLIASRDKLEKIFNDSKYAKENGVKDNRIFLRTVFGDNVKDIEKTRKRIEVAMKRDDSAYEFQYAVYNAISKHSVEMGNDNNFKDICLVRKQNPLLAEGENIKSVVAERKSENIMNDVATLLMRSENYQQLRHDNGKETMRVIAELGTEYFGLAVMKEGRKYIKDVPDDIDNKLNVDYDYKEIEKKFGNVNKVVLGTLGITGVDIMSDGVVNAIPVIAEALNVATPIVGTAVGVIFAAVTTGAVMKDVNRLKKAEYVAAVETINSIHDKIKIEYLERYDEAMQAIRERIEENLIAMKGLNRKIYKQTNATIALNKIEKNLDYIAKEVNKNKYELESVFRG